MEREKGRWGECDRERVREGTGNHGYVGEKKKTSL